MPKLAALINKNLMPFAIVLAFLVLGIVYSLVTPIFEAPDEPGHVLFVKYLADGKGLPIQTSDLAANPTRQEGSQPPLYYLLAALPAGMARTEDMAGLLTFNDHAASGEPASLGNKNVTVHGEAERFPYRNGTLAIHLIRLLSIVLGALTVGTTYFIARELFPGRRYLVLGSAAMVAFNPQFLFISASVNNDNLVIALATAVLYLCLRIIRYGLQGSEPWLLGLCLGLAALSKLSALGLFPVAVLAIGISARFERSPRRFIQGVLIVSALPLLIAGWWYWRNWTLYGDPLGWGMWLRTVGERPVSPTLQSLFPEFRGLELSFWGVFGWMNILAEPFFYRVPWLLVRLAAVGLAIFTLQQLTRRELEPKTLAGLGLLLAWLAILFALLLRFMWAAPAGQGRYLFPAISSIAILLTLGLTSLVPTKLHPALVGAVSALLLGLALLAPFRYIAPAYASTAVALEGQPSIQHPTDLTYGGTIKLLGYNLEQKKVRPGDVARITFFWQALVPVNQNYTAYVHLVGENERLYGQEDTYPGMGMYPTSLWPAGKVVSDSYQVRITGATDRLSLARIKVGFYDFGSRQHLAVCNAAGTEVTPFVGSIKTSPTVLSPVAAQHPVNFRLGETIKLTGYDLEATEARPGQEVRLRLAWQALASPEKDYTVFVQLLGPDGQVWAQQDKQPRDGAYPTSAWEAEEAIPDEFKLRLAPDAPAGTYQLLVGMYSLGDMSRLPVLDGAGKPVPHSAIALALLSVRRD